MKFFNRCRVLTATTGTGDVITLGSAFSAAFLTLAEAGGAQNDETTVCVEQGNDFAIYAVTVGASANTITINSVETSKIGGTAGTARIDLDGTAVIRFIGSAAELNDILARLASAEGTIDLLGSAAFEDYAATGTLSPAQITADQNNYSPTGLSTAFILRLTSDALRNITGLATGALGRKVTLVNIGSYPIALKDAIRAAPPPIASNSAPTSYCYRRTRSSCGTTTRRPGGAPASAKPT